MHPLGTEQRTRATYACAHARDIYHSIPTNCLKRECDNHNNAFYTKHAQRLDANAPRVPLSRIQASPTHWTDGQPRGPEIGTLLGEGATTFRLLPDSGH